MGVNKSIFAAVAVVQSLATEEQGASLAGLVEKRGQGRSAFAEMHRWYEEEIPSACGDVSAKETLGDARETIGSCICP